VLAAQPVAGCALPPPFAANSPHGRGLLLAGLAHLALFVWGLRKQTGAGDTKVKS